MKFHRDLLRLYAVTDRTWTGRQTLYEQIESALKGGVTMVQLREKTLCEDALIREAMRVKALCSRYHVPLIVNDNVDAALKSGADGVHVGIEDTPVSQIRERAPRDFIIGATCKSVAQARLAQRSGADYMGVGAVFPSPTKKTAIRITPRQLREICSSVSIPAVAIGGISLENIMEIKGCGMAGVAVVSAIFSAEDIERAAAALRERAETLTAPGQDCG